MLPVYWSEGEFFVFWSSLFFIIVTLVTRAYQCRRYVADGLLTTGKTITAPFVRASALFVLEPNVGITALRPLLLSEKVEKDQFGYVRSSHSLVHDKDKVTMDTAIRAAWVMLLTEDLPEFIISLIYLYQRGAEADLFFWFSLATTILHTLRQVFEIYHTSKFRPINDFLREHMRWDSEEGKKTFEEAAKTLETYGRFVSELVLKSCGYTADQFESLFKHLSSAMTTIDLSDCTNLTDDAITALAQHCRDLTTIYLTGCRNLTDAAKEALRKKGIEVED